MATARGNVKLQRVDADALLADGEVAGFSKRGDGNTDPDDGLGEDDWDDDEDEDNDSDRPENEADESRVPPNMHPAEHSLNLYKKKLSEMTRKAEYLKIALLRRNDVIESLRTGYLKDVLALKTVINNVLKDDKEREHVLATYNAYIPCVDLTASLPLHNPENAYMMLRPCESCGGCVEVKILDADSVTKLRTQLVGGEFNFKLEK